MGVEHYLGEFQGVPEARRFEIDSLIARLDADYRKEGKMDWRAIADDHDFLYLRDERVVLPIVGLYTPEQGSVECIMMPVLVEGHEEIDETHVAHEFGHALLGHIGKIEDAAAGKQGRLRRKLRELSVAGNGEAEADYFSRAIVPCPAIPDELIHSQATGFGGEIVMQDPKASHLLLAGGMRHGPFYAMAVMHSRWFLGKMYSGVLRDRIGWNDGTPYVKDPDRGF